MQKSVEFRHETWLVRADSMAYTFGEQSGVLYYTFPAVHRPHSDSDRLAFGFSSTQRHATIVSLSSYRRDDLIRVDLASHVTAKTNKINTRNIRQS